MDQFWKDHFPSNPEEAKNWEPIIRHTALDQFVIAAALTRIEGAWCCYIRNVPGFNHDKEYHDVLHTGSKLRESTALTLFPSFKGIPYAR